MKKEDVLSYLKYISVSLSSAGIELFLFDLLVEAMKRHFPLLYVTISTVFARVVADSYKFLLDRKMVFGAEGGITGGVIRYIILAVSKTAASAALVTIIAMSFSVIDETLIKIFVDVGLFFPGYYIEKKWVHEV